MSLRIADAIDLHCHFGPDTIGGTLEVGHGHSVSGLEAAQQAAESGHKAIVLKSHSFASPQLAANLEEMVRGLRVFGGVCTDYPSGGLNVDGVEAALGMGAKIVWLPTVHSVEDFAKRGRHRHDDGPGIGVIDDGGAVVEAVNEIAALVRACDAVLATGHTTAAEHYAVVRAFARRQKVVVTHAGEELAGPGLDAAQCRELADLGATIELTALACQDVMGVLGRSPRAMAETIDEIGADRVVLSTDYGWTTAVPRPAEGLQEFLEALWAEGIAEETLAMMVATTPARLLGLG